MPLHKTCNPRGIRIRHCTLGLLLFIKNIITTSGEQLVVQNVTIADSKVEDVKLENTFNSIDELIKAKELAASGDAAGAAALDRLQNPAQEHIAVFEGLPIALQKHIF